MIIKKAEFVKEITVTDPVSGLPVEISIFKHYEGGGMFGVDSSYLEQCFDDEVDPIIPDPFINTDQEESEDNIQLMGL